MKSKSEAAQHGDALGIWSEEADRKEAHHGGVAAALSRLQPGGSTDDRGRIRGASLLRRI